MSNTEQIRKGLTAGEAASFLGITVTDLNRLHENDEGPAFTLVQRTPRYSVVDLLAYQEERAAKALQPTAPEKRSRRKFKGA